MLLIYFGSYFVLCSLWSQYDNRNFSILNLKKGDKVTIDFTQTSRSKSIWYDDEEYPDRESNSELSFRRALLYPFNYQGNSRSECKGTKKLEDEH